MSTTRLTGNDLNMQSRQSRRSSQRRAFSLIEVIVAVMIVALLAALVVPRFAGFLRSSTRSAAQIETSALHRQVELYMSMQQGGSLPDDFMLEELAEGDDPFLNNKDDLIDPWNNSYVIVIPGDYNIDFDVVSFGKDGQPGGEGENEDVISNKD